MVTTYHRTGSFIEVKRLFRLRFPRLQRTPCKKAIQKNVAKYTQHGTSRNRQSEASGRLRSARSPANIAQVRQAVTIDPELSSRRNPCPNLTQSTFNRITRKDIHLHPYKLQLRHGLLPGDPARRLAFCRWLLNTPPRILGETLMIDEANFYLNGEVCSENVRHYAPKGQPPRNFVYDIPNDRQKLNVWMGMIGNRLIGPVFVAGNLNQERYLDIIENTVVPKLTRWYRQQANGVIRRVWFLQDGAGPHRSRQVHDRLQELFPGRVIGLGHRVEWPPRSPDLTPLDYFLWGYLKSKVYTASAPPRNLQVLERRIKAAVTGLRRTRITSRAVNNMRVRARKCIRLQGRQVEGRAGD